MMEEKTTTKAIVPFLEDSLQTLDNAMKYANILLKSKLAPAHFYDKGKDNKPDYDKGKPEAVLMVLQHGMEVGMTPSQSLQHIVPVNGLMSIKGDGAKSLIFSSGKVLKDSWKETEEGSIEKGDLKVTITATRSDNKETLSRSFSVLDAKRAGLWVTSNQVQSKDGWKYKHSPWWKYPARMVRYRALGFLARDLFPDVLTGLVTEEEALDYPVPEEVAIIETEHGPVKIEHPKHDQERSDSLNKGAVAKIDKEDSQEPGPGEPGLQEMIDRFRAEDWDEDKLLNLGSKIYDLAKQLGLDDQIEKLEGRKSNKKYREALYMFHQGDDVFRFWYDNTMKRPEEPQQDQEPAEKETPQTDEVPEPEKKEPSSDVENFDKQFSEDQGDQEPEKEKKKDDLSEAENRTNKHKIQIPELPEGGSREFEDCKPMYEEMNKIGIDKGRYEQITKGHPFGQKYKSKDIFCRTATVEEINELLNSV